MTRPASQILRYALETYWLDKWVQLHQESSRRYLEGYADAATQETPRRAWRLVDRGTAKLEPPRVLREWGASDEPQIGMVAGAPSEEQCVAAAVKTLRRCPRCRSHGYPPRVEAALTALQGAAVTDGGGPRAVAVIEATR